MLRLLGEQRILMHGAWNSVLAYTNISPERNWWTCSFASRGRRCKTCGSTVYTVKSCIQRVTQCLSGQWKMVIFRLPVARKGEESLVKCRLVLGISMTTWKIRFGVFRTCNQNCRHKMQRIKGQERL